MSIGIVQTDKGAVSGVALKDKYEGLTLFKGIPYAAPPVGELRWRAPQDMEPWEGVRACDKYPGMAVQDFGSFDNLIPYNYDFYYTGYPKPTEDCLYLNVCTGASSAEELRPVYVWFHGGGLTAGYSFEIEFNPEELTRKGIVVVSVGQRLNIFGYLALPQLENEEDRYQGNYGLQDQLKAMEWIKKNIRAFGGDPDNITIGGQSGGSTKCAVMAAIPCMEGQIKNMILESGLKWVQKLETREQAYAASRAYLVSEGIDPDLSAEELRKLPASKFPANYGHGRNNMFADGDLIPYPSIQKLFAHYLKDINILVGCNNGENKPQLRPDLPQVEGFENKEAFYAFYKELLGDLYDTYDFENIFAATDENCYRLARTLTCLGFGINAGPGFSRNLMINRVFAEKRGREFPNSKTFLYFFNQFLPMRDADVGTKRDEEVQMAYHSSELFYTFASLRENVPPIRPWRQEDFELADKVSSYWANFMKQGDPNGEGLPAWPEGRDKTYMELKAELTVHPYGEAGDDLMRAFVKRHYNL